jgi:hypothetical protein
MSDYGSLNHTKWECKYHVVSIPKCRREVLYGKIRRNLGEVFHELAKQRKSQVLEGHLCPDQVHMMIRIPPKYSVSHVMGYIKGRVRFGWPGISLGGMGTSRLTISGHERTSCRPWESMNARSGSTSAIRKRMTRNSTNNADLMTRNAEYGLCAGRINPNPRLRTSSDIHVVGEREVRVLRGFDVDSGS